MNDFIRIREQYNDLREQQRKEIAAYLKDNNFVVKDGRSGRGKKEYTSGNRFITPYDLSNWKWIDCSLDDRNFIISLQCFDVDPNTYNHHVLMDRIGIYAYKKYNSYDAYTKMIPTEIDLPMDDDKLNRLLNLLKDTIV